VRIEDIEEPNGLEYVQVMCSEYIEEIYNDRIGDIPIKIDTGMENPWQCPDVTDLTATEFIQIHPDGTISSNVDVTWKDPNVMLNGVEVLMLEEGDMVWKSCGIISPGVENYVIRNVRANQTLSIKIVAINTKGIKAPGVVTSIILYGKALPPGPPDNITIEPGPGLVSLSWDNPPDVDFSHVDIVEYKGTAHPGYDPAIGTLVASISGTAFTRAGLDEMQTYWYWIRAVDTSGNTSDWVGPVSAVTERFGVGPGEITETEIADNAITTPKLAANAVTADKINVTMLSAIAADLGTVTAGVAKSADGRFEIDLVNRTIKVFDDNNRLRVQLGKLT